MQNTKRIKDYGRYDRSMKREISRRYLAGEFSYRIAAQEYGLRDGNVVKQFVRWYKAQAEYLQPMDDPEENSEGPARTATESTAEELLLRVAKLEKERDQARLAAEGWRTMIDIAEQTFKIEIVKKSVAKPSEK